MKYKELLAIAIGANGDFILDFSVQCDYCNDINVVQERVHYCILTNAYGCKIFRLIYNIT